ncbi:hypothetical protein NPX13_g2355 [Xylaria arbuscula]|uniref:Uncharacterized protein n=1 Tax=Xylaria arbuscula TaxID=114810 RepID=A0A9W8TQI2_9PEZI|nr:hypothetical protein NPX13_g2355 [Xylaria arbuscula]
MLPRPLASGNRKNQVRSDVTIILLLGDENATALLILVIASIRILAASADALAKLPEQERDSAARKTDSKQDKSSPLVPDIMIHLRREEHHAGAPERADESLRGQCRRCAVLVRVDEVVVGAVVDEDEPEAHGEAGERGPHPDEPRVRGPRENDQPDRDEPAREHHGDKTEFGGRETARVRRDDFHVVLVD